MKITISKSQWENIGIRAGWILANDYRGEHSAPGKEHAPLYDLTDSYPDDIYSANAVQYYGHGIPADYESISIIHKAKNKPNMPVKIYRAVPIQNEEYEVKKYQNLINYYNKFNFFPINNSIIEKIENEIEETNYDKKQEKILNYLYEKIEQLQKNIKNIKINPGDWVTLNRAYAKQHGESALNGKYKILSKTVKAKDLNTSADSIHEWGYNP